MTLVLAMLIAPNHLQAQARIIHSIPRPVTALNMKPVFMETITGNKQDIPLERLYGRTMKDCHCLHRIIPKIVMK